MDEKEITAKESNLDINHSIPLFYALKNKYK